MRGLFQKSFLLLLSWQLRVSHAWQMIFAPIMWPDMAYFHSFGKTTRSYWFKSNANHLGSSTILLSFGVTFLALPTIVMNCRWILAHEDSLKCLSLFRIQCLTIVIQRKLLEFEETCCIFILHWRVAHRGRFPGKPFVWMNWNNSNDMFKLQMLRRSMQGMSACRI